MTETKRATSPGAEALIGHVFRVLDHGEVELVDYCGNDEELARVARVSTGSRSEDLGIIDYLVRHRHTSPLEFGEITLRVKLPIFLARQWIRHRTANVSEASARYREMPEQAYVPSPEFVQGPPTQSKQGRGGDLMPTHVRAVRELVEDAHDDARWKYDLLRTPQTAAGPPNHQVLSPPEEGVHFPGVANELARTVLTLGQYTEWYWKIDAHNLMNFLRLRLEPHAQKEIRAYAEVIAQVFEAWIPRTSEAFRNYVFGARTFSARELAVLGQILGSCEFLWNEEGLDLENTWMDGLLDEAGLKGGELVEFREKLLFARDSLPKRRPPTSRKESAS